MNRTVIQAEALAWLNGQEPDSYLAIVTSLPDPEEVGISIQKWKTWIAAVAESIDRVLDPRGIAVFYQTDRRVNGEILDKKSRISAAFYDLGYRTVLSKIALTQNPDTTNLFRPTYTNLFAVSKKATSGQATPDVFGAGKKVYPNATGLKAATVALEYVRSQVGDVVILDPFCGQGSILKIANDLGLDSIGIDIDESQVLKARKL